MMHGFRSMATMAMAAGMLAFTPAQAQAQTQTPEQSATALAHQWARAVTTRDVDAQMKLLPMAMYAKPGERERNRLQRLHEKEVALINKQQIIAFDVRAPIQTLKIDKTTAVVIPYQSIVTVAEGKLQTDSVLVALSEDGSDKWSIFDGTGHTTRSLKSLIPGYTTGLSVSPARSQLIRGE